MSQETIWAIVTSPRTFPRGLRADAPAFIPALMSSLLLYWGLRSQTRSTSQLPNAVGHEHPALFFLCSQGCVLWIAHRKKKGIFLLTIHHQYWLNCFIKSYRSPSSNLRFLFIYCVSEKRGGALFLCRRGWRRCLSSFVSFVVCYCFPKATGVWFLAVNELSRSALTDPGPNEPRRSLPTHSTHPGWITQANHSEHSRRATRPRECVFSVCAGMWSELELIHKSSFSSTGSSRRALMRTKDANSDETNGWMTRSLRARVSVRWMDVRFGFESQAAKVWECV